MYSRLVQDFCLNTGLRKQLDAFKGERDGDWCSAVVKSCMYIIRRYERERVCAHVCII